MQPMAGADTLARICIESPLGLDTACGTPRIAGSSAKQFSGRAERFSQRGRGSRTPFRQRAMRQLQHPQAGRLRRRRLLPLRSIPRTCRKYRIGSFAREADRAPPPPRRMDSIGTPISLKSVKESRRLNATPSRMARITCARECCAVIPTSAPRASGSRWGVRSPIK